MTGGKEKNKGGGWVAGGRGANRGHRHNPLFEPNIT